MGEEYKNIFEKFLYEAPDEEPPDAAQAADTGPPNIPDGAGTDPTPPDMPDTDAGGTDDTGAMDAPPDMGGDDDFGDAAMDDGTGEESENNQEGEQPIEGLDEKVSAIMNQQLYQKFLSMLNTIGSQLSQLKSNSDILYAISPESLEIKEQLSKLDENIRLHLKNSFLDDNYSKNLLFFNKCLNLLKLLNDNFSNQIKKGIKAVE